MSMTIRIPFQRVPYGYVEETVEEVFGEDGTLVFHPPDLEAIMQRARAAEDAYIAAFYGEPVEEAPINGAPHPADDAELLTYREPRQPLPHGTQPQQRRAQNGQGGPGGAQYGVRVTCPEHGVDCRPSVKNKTIEFDDSTGLDIPASWFHSKGEGRGTCTVWRSRAQVEVL